LGTALGVLLPIIIAYKSAGVVANWMTGPGGAAAEGAGVAGAGASGLMLPLAAGTLTKLGLDALDPNKSADAWADKNIPGYAWLDYRLNKMVNGTGNDAADRAAFDKARGLTNVTVHVSIDGKDLPSTVKTTVDHASGPLTGTGNYDSQKSYLPTEH
jgi:hypothetical protein